MTTEAIQNVADKSVQTVLSDQISEIPAIGMIIAFVFGVFIDYALARALSKSKKWPSLRENEGWRVTVAAFFAGVITTSISSAFGPVWTLWWLMGVTGFVGGLAGLFLIPFFEKKYGPKPEPAKKMGENTITQLATQIAEKLKED